MYTILKPGDIDFNNITYYKPVKTINNKYNISLFYIHNGNKIPLIVQTPKLYLPFNISDYGLRTYLDVSLQNLDEEQIDFYNFLIKINNKIKFLKETKLSNFICQDCDYLNNIKKNEPYPDKLRLSLDKDIKIFDENKNVLSLEKLKSKTHAKFLINFSDIWINNKKYGINNNILQILFFLPVKLTEFNFIDDEHEVSEKNNKYDDMLKKGVSKMAIEHKMKMDGIIKINKTEIENPFLKAIKKGVKLKKAETENSSQKTFNSNFLVHNLNEIIKCKSTLRKI